MKSILLLSIISVFFDTYFNFYVVIPIQCPQRKWGTIKPKPHWDIKSLLRYKGLWFTTTGWAFRGLSFPLIKAGLAKYSPTAFYVDRPIRGLL